MALSARMSRVSIFAVILVSVAGLSVRAADIPKAARLLPDRTILLAEIENFDTLWQQFSQTSYYQMYKDPAMKEFFDHFRSKREDTASKSKSGLIKAVMGSGILPQGRVAAAVVVGPEASISDTPAFIIMAEWGDGISKIREAVGKDVAWAVEEGARKKSEDYRSVAITTLTTEDAPEEVGSGSEPSGEDKPKIRNMSYCFIDDCLIVSNKIDEMKFVIAQIKGAGSSTLADNGDYSDSMAAVGPHHDVDVYVNIKQIIRAALVDDEGGKNTAMLANLGLDNVISLSGAMGVARLDGKASGMKLRLKVDGPKRGICKMLDVESNSLALPRFIPADAASVAVINLNVKKAYTELLNMVMRFGPQYAAILQMPFIPVNPQTGERADIKTAIIDHLGSQLFVAERMKQLSDGSDPAEMPSETIVALAAGNRAALEKSLAMVHMVMIAKGRTDLTRELLGHNIYMIDMISLLGGGQDGSNQSNTPLAAQAAPAPVVPKLAFTVTDTHVILGQVSAVENAIRSLGADSGERIESARWFRRARAAVPTEAGLGIFENSAESGSQYWDTLKKMAEAQDQPGNTLNLSIGASSAGGVLPQVMFAGSHGLFDFSLLPDFEKVKKYFGLSAAYAISREDGFFFEFKMLEP